LVEFLDGCIDAFGGYDNCASWIAGPFGPYADDGSPVASLGRGLAAPFVGIYHSGEDAWDCFSTIFRPTPDCTTPQESVDRLNAIIHDPVGVVLGACGSPNDDGSYFFGCILSNALLIKAGSRVNIGEVGGELVQGPYGSVSSKVLDLAAESGGPTTRVVTRLTEAPQAGRALSVATGDGADALASAARTGGLTYAADIPNTLLVQLERVGLARRVTTSMGGVTAQEIRFMPGASDYIVRFFERAS
jgi:hypothetical protein